VYVYKCFVFELFVNIVLVFPCAFFCWFFWHKATRDVVLGSCFFGVSPASFSDCAFFFYVFFRARSVFFGWVLYDTRLFMMEISGFDSRLLQREVPGEGACLHALVSVTTFFPMPVSFGFCLGFLFVFLFTIYLCYAQLLLDYLLT
jgi:hypothetical protein